MYIPPQFEEVRETEIFNIIENFPLATVVCNNGGDLIANHIPLLRVNHHAYLGHIASENSLHSIFSNGVNAIAIFSAENSYISPNWYPTKVQTHQQVPTWNYQVVHLKGRISFNDSKKAKLRAVGTLTKYFERMHFGDAAWKMSDAPKDFIEQQLDNIIALDFKVDTIIAKSKLSQNKTLEDFNSVKQNIKKENKEFMFNSMNKIGNGQLKGALAKGGEKK